MKLTVLGCGPSGGVPLIGQVWGACDPAQPKNRRRRCSLLIEDGEHTILIDTSPDLREQLLTTDVKWLDAVLYTHAHSDHAHGIDELRPMFFGAKKGPVQIYGMVDTINELRTRFSYLFSEVNNEEYVKIYPKIIDANIIEHRVFKLFHHNITTYKQDHGNSITTGYRFDSFAYSTDVVRLDDEAFEALSGIDTWFVDCLSMTPRPTHSWLDQTLEWISLVKPRRAILIHMNHELDYDTLKKELPLGVEPAYDGMIVEV